MLQPGLEFIAPQKTKLFGSALLAEVEAISDAVANDPTLMSTKALEARVDALAGVIHDHMKLDIAVVLTERDGPGMCLEVITGHGGVTGRFSTQRATGKHSAYQDKFLKVVVDLNKGTLSGDTSGLHYDLVLPLMVFNQAQFTPRQTTAMILHEIGHAFFQLATLGEYVLLDYCLTDGMEVILNKKPNRYRLDILDDGYLQKHVSDETKVTLREAPTEKNYRRALLEVYGRTPRLHLMSQWAGLKRDEQLADMFASRAGFSKDLAEAVYRLHSPGLKRYFIPRDRFRTVQLLRTALFGTVLLPLTVMMLFAKVTFSEEDTDYDNPTQRIAKIRRDLIAQLQDTSLTKGQKKTIDADIKAIDAMLVTMNEHATVYEMIQSFVTPSLRRERQRLHHEEQLQALLHNDLYVWANRLSLR